MPCRVSVSPCAVLLLRVKNGHQASAMGTQKLVCSFPILACFVCDAQFQFTFCNHHIVFSFQEQRNKKVKQHKSPVHRLLSPDRKTCSQCLQQRIPVSLVKKRRNKSLRNHPTAVFGGQGMGRSKEPRNLFSLTHTTPSIFAPLNVWQLYSYHCNG